MELVLKRSIKTKTSTIGDLTVDGEKQCFVLEDYDRGLTDSMTLSEIKKAKVYGRTAIPTGRYEVVVSYSNKFKKYLPLLLNVKGFEGIRIHGGNYAEDSFGCLLMGKEKAKDMILQSQAALKELLPKIDKASKKEKIFITIN